MALDGSLARNACASLERGVVGFLLAALVGTALGVALGWWRVVSDVVRPVVEVFRPIPPIAWTTLAILWFGVGSAPSYFLVFMGSVFAVFVNTDPAVRGLERTQISAALCLGAPKGGVTKPSWTSRHGAPSRRGGRQTGSTGRPPTAPAPSLLAGLVHDETGEPMTPTHATNGGTRYRYYDSQSLIRPGRPGAHHAGRRLPAGEREALLETRIGASVAGPSSLFESLEPIAGDALQRTAMVEAAATPSRQCPQRTHPDRRMVVHRLVWRIDIQRDRSIMSRSPSARRRLRPA